MIYKISRTSELNDKKPCEKAYQKEVPLYQERMCSEKYYNSNFADSEGGKWRDIGTEHECETKNIRRRKGNKTVWVIKISSLKQLMSLTKEYGELIFTEDEIKIYDDYRE